MALMIPSPDGGTRRQDSTRRRRPTTRDELDALVLMGGSDVCPETLRRTGAQARMERRPHPRRLRDRAAARVRERGQAGARRLPRRAGHQRRVRRHALPGHRDADARTRSTIATGTSTPRTAHATSIVAGSGLARLYPGLSLTKTNSVHHQSVKDRRPRSRRRGVVGARPRGRGAALDRDRRTCSACSGIRNSTRTAQPSFIDDTPILDDFLARARH